MKIKQASRSEVKLRIGISAASGFGKTYSALQMGFGITNDWSKICVIDSESSASLYSHLGPFNVIEIEAPFTPEKYIEAIKLAENSGMKLIVLDSISHEWSGSGGCLEIHEQLGGRWQDWAKVTPRHQAFIDSIILSKCHIITCVRRKTEYILDTDINGRMKVTKLGTKEVTKGGFEFELTLNFEIINEQHLAKASKDRTGLYMNKPEFVISPATGEQLIDWATMNDVMNINKLLKEISECKNKSELSDLFNKNPELSKSFSAEFSEHEKFLNSLTTNIIPNGQYTHPHTS